MLRASGVPPLLSRYQKPLTGFEWIGDVGRLNSIKGVYLVGPAGVGKSIQAVLIMRNWFVEWAQQEGLDIKQPSGAWKFVSCANLVMRIQDAWKTGEESAYKILTSIAEVPHLIIDDLGTEKPTDYVKQAVYFIFNEREQWQRQTIVTSNFSLDKIDRQYDTRVGSRIAGMCDIREIKGKDRRVEK
jgi:DNA replication protein DnaC